MLNPMQWLSEGAGLLPALLGLVIILAVFFLNRGVRKYA
jgi:hypothetical protein